MDLALARALRDAELASLAGLSDEVVDYLARLDEFPGFDSEGVECGDGPHLTADEWAYIEAVTGG
jgi:hypothetical protein